MVLTGALFVEDQVGGNSSSNTWTKHKSHTSQPLFQFSQRDDSTRFMRWPKASMANIAIQAAHRSHT
jgi:hypothetical protein